MKPCHLTISSKNLLSIRKLLLFFQNNIEPNFNIVRKCFQQKRKRKILTILKSPHVNKTAQEHFEYRTFSKQFILYSSQYSKHLILLKRLKTNLFPDVKIKVKLFANKKNVDRLRIKIFHIDNFTGDFYSNPISQNSKSKEFGEHKMNHTQFVEKTKKTLKVIDIYGELLKKIL